MIDSANPYRSPASDAGTLQSVRTRRLDGIVLSAWLFVFAMNMAVPLLIGLDETRHHGRIGMCVASLLMLIVGWMFCFLNATAGRKLILGASVVALTQVFPILQILAGSISIGICQSLQLLAQGGDDAHFGLTVIDSEFGGFVVTMLVGIILLSCAGMAGLVLGQVLPAKWFVPVPRLNPDASCEDRITRSSKSDTRGNRHD